MYIYLLVFIFIGLLSILNSLGTNKKLQILGLFTIFLVLFIIAGLKYETGVDWFLYKQVMDHAKPIFSLFSDIRSGYYKNDIDIGYTFLLSLVKTLGGGMQTIYFIIAFFTLSNLIYHFNKYTPNAITAVLVYYAITFFILDMSGIRQCISVNFFLMSIRYIYKKKFTKYLFIMLTAASFHWSAFFLIPIYFLLTRNYSTKGVVIFFIIQLIIFFFQIKWLKEFLELFFPLISNKKLMEKAFLYTSASAYASAREFDLITISNVLFYIILFFFIIIFRKQLCKRFVYFNIFFNIFLCNIFIFFCTSELQDISNRIQYYFLLSNAILLSYIAFLFNKKTEKIIVSVLIILYSFGYCKAYILESIYTIAYHPYQNYVIYKLWDKPSTARYRLEIHKRLHIKEGLIEN